MVDQSATRVQRATAALRGGGLVLLLDAADREDEGDFVVAAQFAEPRQVNEMITVGRGLLCVAVDEEIITRLSLPQMAANNDSPHETAFTVSVDIANGGTGISASDRSATIKAIADPGSRPGDFVRPGHVFPLRAARGGVVERQGHTEASVELMKLAGLRPAAAICEILDAEGEPARRPFLSKLAAEMDIPVLTVTDVLNFHDTVTRAVQTTLPTVHGSFDLFGYRDSDDIAHLALVAGDVGSDSPTLVRIHSECLTGDVLGSLRCDCGTQLDESLRLIAARGAGVLVYLRGHEGRGIGLLNKLRAYALQDNGRDTVDANIELGFRADERSYRVAAAILRDLGVSEVELLTNNPTKVAAMSGYGFRCEMVGVQCAPTIHNFDYLETKQRRMSHRLDLRSPSAHTVQEMPGAVLISEGMTAC